ncbi:MAG: hypothetical protein ACI9T7_003177 [Oleiphilaceae bacterium]|jgi:hypothetical protein
MLMAGAAYNLKKYLKFIEKKAASKVGTVKAFVLLHIDQILSLKMGLDLN